MTREEAIANLKELLECNYVDSFEDAENEALEMAIQALSQEQISLDDINNALGASFRNGVRSAKVEQEPCDDAISRILKKMWNCRGKHTTSIDKVAMEQIIRDELSVTQKPIECDDAISRQAVLDGLKGCICEDWVKTLFATMVKQLPSVTHKSGKWIVHPKGIYAHLVCNRCLSNAPYDYETNYCPYCGAKMVEPQESEDKGCGK